MRAGYKIYDKDGIYFITSSIVEFIPVFVDDKMFRIITDSLEFCRNEMNLKIFAYVIMDNHFHAALSAPELTKVMKNFKRYTANRILKELKTKKNSWLLNQLNYWKKGHKSNSYYQVWQEGFHPQQIKDADMLRQKVKYIHYNPVRRGLVKAPEYWKYSSASNYAGQESVIEIDNIW